MPTCRAKVKQSQIRGQSPAHSSYHGKEPRRRLMSEMKHHYSVQWVAKSSNCLAWEQLDRIQVIGIINHVSCLAWGPFDLIILIFKHYAENLLVGDASIH